MLSDEDSIVRRIAAELLVCVPSPEVIVGLTALLARSQPAGSRRGRTLAGRNRPVQAQNRRASRSRNRFLEGRRNVNRFCILLAEAESYRSRGGTSQYVLLLAAVRSCRLWRSSAFTCGTCPANHETAETKRPRRKTSWRNSARVHELTRPEQSLIALVGTGRSPRTARLGLCRSRAARSGGRVAVPDAPRYRALRQKLFGFVN